MCRPDDFPPYPSTRLAPDQGASPVTDPRSKQERVYVRALTRYERRERVWGLTSLVVINPDLYDAPTTLAALSTREWMRPLVKQARDLVARLEP